jgi:hypothetical protein
MDALLFLVQLKLNFNPRMCSLALKFSLSPLNLPLAMKSETFELYSSDNAHEDERNRR